MMSMERKMAVQMRMMGLLNGLRRDRLEDSSSLWRKMTMKMMEELLCGHHKQETTDKISKMKTKP